MEQIAENFPLKFENSWLPETVRWENLAYTKHYRVKTWCVRLIYVPILLLGNLLAMSVVFFHASRAVAFITYDKDLPGIDCTA